MARQEWSWTALQSERAAIAKKIVYELEPWWPVIVRQIHYQLFSRLVEWRPSRNGQPGYYRNIKSESNMLSTLLKWMRIDNVIPWKAITDEWRDVYQPRKHEDKKDYIKEEVEWFLDDYRRCLLQNQSRYIEVYVEKQALIHMVKEVAEEYCLLTKVTRYDSITHLKSFADRGRQAVSRKQRPTILYLGDLDPSGVDMETSSMITLRDELGFTDFDWYRIALTPHQVHDYRLPFDPTAGKKTDTRYKKYVEKYGEVFVELDALHPKTLQSIVRDEIEDFLDMDDFSEQKEIEEEELDEIEKVKAEVIKLLTKKGLFG